MGYGKGALQMLSDWMGNVLPVGGKLLELGSQDLNADIPIADIRNALSQIHQDDVLCERQLKKHFSEPGPWKVARLFEESTRFSYSAIDLYPGKQIIVADLNHYIARSEEKCQFDLITNFGTTEHVTDQVNVFRLMHDFLKPGGYAFHSVPCSGYLNHGLYNYNPIFFLFLANANGYKVNALALSEPHFPYTIPPVKWLAGTERWRGLVVQSSVVNCLLQKIDDRPFAMFTDFDRSVIQGQGEQSDLDLALRDRYDLRIRD